MKCTIPECNYQAEGVEEEDVPVPAKHLLDLLMQHHDLEGVLHPLHKPAVGVHNDRAVLAVLVKPHRAVELP